ncbi:MAG TPA: phosphatidylglycerophosphatase A, partial [Terriglobia bacterium]|nr:phosphatidylglycerophosphatase A [Terriglobia bacterium]
MSELPRGAAVRIATVGPVGWFPVAPGTVGSTVGVAVATLIERLPLGRTGIGLVLGGTTALVYLVGVWAAGRAEKAFETVDPGPVVIDEVAGQMVTFLLRPAAGWTWLIGG